MDSLTVDSPDREQEVDAVLKLGCLPGVGTRTLWRILETYGALAALTSLELEGWVIQEPGMRFRRAS